jgi:predicted glycosyltransferase
MNREAVALGAPAFTVFEGRLGAVDEQLIAQGRLQQLRDPEQVVLVKRPRAGEGSSARVRRDPRLLTDLLLRAAITAT